MDFFERWLERFFGQTDKLQAKLSEDWRYHTNRRSLAIIIVVGIVVGLVYVFVVEPPDQFPAGAIVTVAPGASLDAVAQTLYETGYIRSELAFKVLVIFSGHERSIIAGDYEFKEPANVFVVAHAVSVGAFGLVPVKIRIPEGATMKQMAILYASELPRFNALNFIAQTPAYEGYLFPDTYFFLPDATEATVIEAMRQDFSLRVAPAEAIIASSSHSFSDIITMASIIEKEAPDTEDRQVIAGILWKRLAKGLPLQVDSTIIYELGKPDLQLTIQDLQSNIPYNTYTHKGLPPTPIGSPSLDSIEAAAEATTSPYLYYLADQYGITHYCKTFTCQQANERTYLGR